MARKVRSTIQQRSIFGVIPHPDAESPNKGHSSIRPIPMIRGFWIKSRMTRFLMRRVSSTVNNQQFNTSSLITSANHHIKKILNQPLAGSIKREDAMFHALLRPYSFQGVMHCAIKRCVRFRSIPLGSFFFTHGFAPILHLAAVTRHIFIGNRIRRRRFHFQRVNGRTVLIHP